MKALREARRHIIALGFSPLITFASLAAWKGKRGVYPAANCGDWLATRKEPKNWRMSN